jgi:protoheme IX farnesyltransferase
MIKTYYSLTKPGMIRGNMITMIAGFVLASGKNIDLWLLLATLIGLALVIASGCVLNNYYDRGIDKKMERTKDRALVKGEVTGQNAIVFGIVLGLIGLFILAFFTNLLTASIALLGAVVYLGWYTPLKHRSMHAAIVGTIAGAVPPVVGYCAVTNQFDGAALILFLILVFWQIPHFYAIAIYRMNEYAAAGVPVISVKKGIFMTKIHMVLYINAFITTALMLTLFGFTGYMYALIVLILGLTWLCFALYSFKIHDDNRRWYRKLFLISLMILIILSITISVDSVVRSEKRPAHNFETGILLSLQY